MQPRESYNHPGPLGRPMTLPSRGLWLHHAAYEPLGDTESRVRRIAQVGIDRFGRSSYSFVIDPLQPEEWWEMQGHHLGVHTAKQNSTSHAVCVIGNFETQRPSGELLASLGALVRFGYENKWWSRDTLLGGHRDNKYSSTACPGRHLYAAIPTINRIARETPMPTNNTPSAWAQEAWDWAVKNGLANEHTDPKDPVDKQEMFVFLKRYHDRVDSPSGTVANHTHQLSLDVEVK